MGKRGQQPIQIDWEKAEKLAGIHCTGEEIADILDVSYDTLERRCKDDHKIKFADWIAKKGSTGKASLRRRQFKKAMDGNATMLIWLGKQWLGQKDRQELDVHGDTAITLNYSDKDL